MDKVNVAYILHSSSGGVALTLLDEINLLTYLELVIDL